MTEFTAEPVTDNLDTAIQAWDTQQALIDRFIQTHFQEGNDFHIVKGKPSLGKAGAEKLASLFHLRPVFTEDIATRAMLGDELGLVCFICVLYTRTNEVFAEGRGARRLALDPGDPNKTVKMVQKSAQIDAVLRGLALSGKYTQDMEDVAVDAAQKPPQMTPQSQPAGNRHDGTPSSDGTEVRPFLASELRQKDHNGKTYWNVFGEDMPKRYSQYGIPLWPFAVKASGIDLTHPPDIQGWQVQWSLQEYNGSMRPQVDLLVDPGKDDDDGDVPF